MNNGNKIISSRHALNGILSPTILTFSLLLLSLCFLITSSSSVVHFQAKGSLDSDENIGKGIDEWPNSGGGESNSTLTEDHPRYLFVNFRIK